MVSCVRQLAARLARMPAAVLIALVRFYRFAFSPCLGASCRFEPTCSAYALEALQRRGAFVGASLTLWRIARCHPACQGGHDPVPDPAGTAGRRLFSFLPNGAESRQVGPSQTAATERRVPRL